MSDLRRILWIASFPKSGNTWLRSFLARYFLPDAGLDINALRRFTTADVRQDFFDRASGRSPFVAEDFDEWVEVRQKAIRLIAASKPNMHFVKTHSRIDAVGPHPLIPPDVTAAAIYLLRNPFDVAQSYSRHLGFDLDTTIGMMMNPKALNASPTRIFEVIGRWDGHIESWLGAPGLQRHVMRYEDMIADPEAAFRAVLGFLGAPVKDGPLRKAIRETSFSKLKKQEQEKGFIERPAHMEAFFARGQAGSWREELTPAQVARLRQAFLPALERWFPELLDETAEVAARA
ncbi:MAG: sulfotransferase domain-containing protein [Pseudomonadota bacterium]